MTADAAVRTEQILAEMTMPAGVHAEVLSSSLARGGHAAHLVAWGPATPSCPGCGQSEWPVERSCPVTVDSGAWGQLQTWNHQHGCGTWWSPPWTSRGLSRWEPTEEAVREVIEELVETVRDRDEFAVGEVQRGLRKLLTDVLAELAAGADVPDEVRGSEVESGVWHDGEQWQAWDFDPRDPEGIEFISVSESDLAHR